MPFIAKEPIPRLFAEYAENCSWFTICQVAEQLESVEIISFLSDGDGFQLLFSYAGYMFAITQAAGGRLSLSVENGPCPDELLLAVSRHFAAYFSPHLREC